MLNVGDRVVRALFENANDGIPAGTSGVVVVSSLVPLHACVDWGSAYDEAWYFKDHVARALDRTEIASDEVRLTDPKTGAQKGVKDARYDLIPPKALHQLALVYGMGAKKYDEWNWAKGYPWLWSFGAMMRHAWAWARGESIDPESGLPHMAHVAWHAMTLITFEKAGLGTDNRFIEAGS